jgi:hypothetical protein
MPATSDNTVPLARYLLPAGTVASYSCAASGGLETMDTKRTSG